jgi:hypothetical protein
MALYGKQAGLSADAAAAAVGAAAVFAQRLSSASEPGSSYQVSLVHAPQWVSAAVNAGHTLLLDASALNSHKGLAQCSVLLCIRCCAKVVQQSLLV